MLDFNSHSGWVPGGRRTVGVADEINERIDFHLVTENQKQTRRRYIQASRIGEDCTRMVQMEYMGLPYDADKEFTGKTIRIFNRGHDGEDKVAKWIVSAGYDLRVMSNAGRQYGFTSLDGNFSGHIDGVIVGLKSAQYSTTALKVPALWEHKTLGQKSWNEVVKQGVQIAKPVYAGQVAIYQGYMPGLSDNPALFTAMNADTQELHCELVPFNASLAQDLTDRAVNIYRDTKAGEMLPRVAGKPDFYICKMCNFQKGCWGMPT